MRPDVAWPAASTIGDILKREGLIEARRASAQADGARRDRAPARSSPTGMGDRLQGLVPHARRERCDPLTITDTASRYLIEARIVEPTWAGVQRGAGAGFRGGRPARRRSAPTTAAPFGSTGAGGLSSAVGVVAEARHRAALHSAVEPAGQRPARAHAPHAEGGDVASRRQRRSAEQQARFDAFRRHYNEERPHEALGQTPPATPLAAARRARCRARLEDPWYDADHEVRRVRPQGDIKWRGEHVFIGEALAASWSASPSYESGGHIVRFCNRDLGVIDRDLSFPALCSAACAATADVLQSPPPCPSPTCHKGGGDDSRVRWHCR